MSRQDKATTEKNARTLRELVKQTDNKSCADCRRNDARWASWNLGVFVCIRCSGIHRSMGTHISKVKSIDLDIWQPEQMESMKKWGNRRANLYWEKHLKAGHNPPDHKMESFIRSKYESRRWAMNGPPPADPSVLENGEGEAPPPPPQETRPTPTTSRPTPTSAAPAPTPVARHALLSTAMPPPKPAAAPPKPSTTIDLLSGDFGFPSAAAPTPAPKAPAPTPAATSAPAPAPGAGLFDLDFHPPTSTAASKPAGQASKNDIMSLFSAAPPAPVVLPQAQNPYASWGGGATDSSGFGNGFDNGFGGGFGAQAQPTSAPVGGARPRDNSLSAGMGGMNLGGGMGANIWGSSAVPSPPANPYAQNPFPTTPQAYQTNANSTANTNHYMSSQDAWGAPAAPAQSKPDAFADIWK